MKLSFVFSTLLLFLSACTYSSSSTKFPHLKDEAAVSAEVDQLVTSDGFDVNGMTKNENGTVTTELTIDVYNPQDLPKDGSAKQGKAREIAAAVKNNLENASEFSDYKVEFVMDSGVTEWYGFSAEDL